MEENFEKLKLHTKEITDIMLLAQSSFKILEYLEKECTELEKEIITHNRFLKHTCEINWRVYVIELSKLFTDRKSDSFNLHSFIGKFKGDFEFHKFKQIDQYSIQIWEQNLKLEKEKIDNLLLQRDKLYSHTDKNREHVKNILSFTDASELLKIVQRIVSEIYSAVFDTQILFKPIGEPLDDLKKILKVLVNERISLIESYETHCINLNIDPKSVGL